MAGPMVVKISLESMQRDGANVRYHQDRGDHKSGDAALPLLVIHLSPLNSVQAIIRNSGEG